MSLWQYYSYCKTKCPGGQSMDGIDSIVVDTAPVTTLQVFHKRLKIPLPVYLDGVAEFTDPWDEQAYQLFVQHYLDEMKDPGILGMVRQEHDDHYVYLDAVIRYPSESPLGSQ
ncbi:hypothetical protein [Desulfitobacterium hafniense]|uniref:Uncharacterized protein n=2 Tax=Desulfitobacterium hafniense TaxID=49338 RepID=Q24V94_DESHY|nr:hypothetical protein DSY2259 [Desulfitobacterium hafniense Y51]